MSAFPTAFSDQLQPLPVDHFNDAGRQAVDYLASKGYEVRVGLTEPFATAIKVLSLQPTIREYCPRDCSVRFASREATETWLSKGRCVFLLIKPADEGSELLAGYGWCGPETSSHVSGGETTFAPRISETDQGHGLAAPYSLVMLQATAALFDARNFWLETWASNGGAVHVYHKMGFTDVSEQPGTRPRPSGEQVDDTRIYMTYPNELLP